MPLKHQVRIRGRGGPVSGGELPKTGRGLGEKIARPGGAKKGGGRKVEGFFPEPRKGPF